jgi:hypothetical protein
MLVQVVKSIARQGEPRQVTSCRVFGRVSDELRSGSKREAPHDTLLFQGVSSSAAKECLSAARWPMGGAIVLDLRSQTTSGAAGQGTAVRPTLSHQATSH